MQYQYLSKVTDSEGIEWWDLSGDGGVLKRIVEEGKGDIPPPKSHCRIAYTLKVLQTGKKIDERKFTFQLNMGAIKAWDICMSGMKAGERCILQARKDYAYGDRGSGCDIPAKATLEYEIYLRKWELDWEPWDPRRKLVLAYRKKAEGNTFFKAKNFHKAKKRYNKVHHILRKSAFQHNWKEPWEAELKEGKKLHLGMNCNLSAVAFKKKKYRECIKLVAECIEVYKRDYKKEKQPLLKLYYRRSVSFRKILWYKEAMADIKKALKIDPDNKLFQKEKVFLDDLNEKVRRKEVKAFTGMFGAPWKEMDVEETQKNEELKNHIEKNEERLKEELKERKRREAEEDSDDDYSDDSDDDDDGSDNEGGNEEEGEESEEKKKEKREKKERKEKEKETQMKEMERLQKEKKRLEAKISKLTKKTEEMKKKVDDDEEGDEKIDMDAE